jgi:hypothetical protein
MELVVSTAIPKTPEISDWPADFQYDMLPLYKTTPWTAQQDYSPCLDRNLRFIHHAEHLDQPAHRLLLPSAYC